MVRNLELLLIMYIMFGDFKLLLITYIQWF
jgi:hypothetical protein